MGIVRNVERVKKPAFDKDKFENLVLYIVSKCPDPTKLGAVRLRKILYYSDAYRYLRTGAPITGATYVKWQGGPVPSQLKDTLAHLEERGAMKSKRASHPLGYPMVLYYAFEEPDLTRFSSDEISLADDVMRIICTRYTAGEISKTSHHNAWVVAEVGEELPIESIIVSRFGEIDEDDVSWAKEKIREMEGSGKQSRG